MKKKLIITGFTCIFMLITGVCYSCTYGSKVSPVIVSSDLITKGAEDAASSSTNSSASITPIAKDSNSINLISEASHDNQTEQTKEYVYVHICGAVVNPGVYRAEAGARLYEFLELAGGLTANAAGDYINQAQLVTDGERIYIPNQEEIEALTLEEIMAGKPDKESANNNSDLSDTESIFININTASAEELMKLSGIGQARANSIVAYREKNGKFKSIEELMNVPGIKEGLFHQISHMIVAN